MLLYHQWKMILGHWFKAFVTLRSSIIKFIIKRACDISWSEIIIKNKKKEFASTNVREGTNFWQLDSFFCSCSCCCNVGKKCSAISIIRNVSHVTCYTGHLSRVSPQSMAPDAGMGLNIPTALQRTRVLENVWLLHVAWKFLESLLRSPIVGHSILYSWQPLHKRNHLLILESILMDSDLCNAGWVINILICKLLWIKASAKLINVNVLLFACFMKEKVVHFKWVHSLKVTYRWT